MSPDFLPFRQVHLDFHTHGDIEGIGADFDADTFGETLAQARVNSINLFARGHHGYVYYETEAFADRMHPHLSCNLLAQQLDACHARGIKATAYITVQWDMLTAQEHPEWLVIDPTGKYSGHGLYDAGFYNRICLNTPYVDFLKAFTADVMEKLPADGIWYDIVSACDCSCRWCRTGMLEEGLDPSDPEVRRAYGVKVLHTFQREMSDFVRARKADALVFFNAGHVGPSNRATLDSYSHLELESLPTGGWGYIHFPVTSRYARTLDKDYLGMTGKFHTSWGDFHSFKNQAALEYECFMMLALNAKCCVGDQLHPRGVLCPHTYDLIGAVYSQVEAREAYCRDARPIVDIGVLTPEEFAGGSHASQPKAIMGVTRILQESRHQFDIIDTKASFEGYKLLILPDSIPVDESLKAKLQQYLADGGALIASHRSGLDPKGESFQLPVGARYEGEADFTPVFVAPVDADFGRDLRPTEHVMYLTGTRVSATDGATVLAESLAPYFNRGWRQFCSHRHAPSSGQSAGPAVVRHGQAIYFAQPIFTQYQQNAPRWCRTMVENAIAMLLPEPLLRLSGPHTLMAAVNEQPAAHRQLVHLLHYVPVRNNDSIDIVEDHLPVDSLAVSLRVDGKVRGVTMVPELEGLPFEQEGRRVNVVLPRLDGYQILAVDLED